MKIRLIYPKWSKLAGQREFHLPPHGPVVFAAAVPEEHELLFTDENIDQIDLDEKPDLVCLSMMLTCQTPRGFEVADHFRARGVPVICGGIAAALHVDECAAHCDAVFVGEVEGRVEGLLEDLRLGRLKKVYDHLTDPVPIELVGTARRSILNRPAYRYRGVQMVDLVHASRGCRFNCYPCCVSYLGGRSFRPRPIDKVVAEVESIPNNRLFFVDNSLAQDKQWELDLFKALAPLKRAIISHPVQDDDDVLRAAADAGHLPAQEHLARLVISTNYQAGPIRSSQRRTYVEALTWLAVALRRGYEPAQQILPHAIGQRLTGEAPKARVTRDEPFSDLPVTWIDAASKRAARLFRCWPVAGKRP